MKPVEVAGPLVVLTGPGIDAVRYAVRVAQWVRQRNGQPRLSTLAELANACELAADGQTDSSATRYADTDIDGITVVEAARRIGCSTRTARRLAPKLGGRRIGGRWLLDPHAVAEHIGGQIPP